MSSKRKQSSPSSARSREQRCAGYSLLELLLAMGMMVVVGAIAFGTRIRGSTASTTPRSGAPNLNQNLRSAVDMIATDARQSGGRLPCGLSRRSSSSTCAAGDRLTVAPAS